MTQLTFDDMLGDFDPAAAAGESETKVDRPSSWYTGRVLSHSSINLYKSCPQKWKFRYVDKVPEAPKPFFSFGKSVHTGLEFLFERSAAAVPSLEDVLAHYKLHWIREGYDTVPQERFYYQEGERIIKGFYVKHQQEFHRVFKVELKFTIDVDGVPVTGFIDRLDQMPSGNIAVIDYKTGKPFDKSRVRQDPQLTLYQIAVQSLFQKKVESLTLYHLNSLTPLTVDAHSAEMEESYRATVVETAKAIVENKFEPKVDLKGACHWCDYTQICPAMAGKVINRAPAAENRRVGR